MLTVNAVFHTAAVLLIRPDKIPASVSEVNKETAPRCLCAQSLWAPEVSVIGLQPQLP